MSTPDSDTRELIARRAQDRIIDNNPDGEVDNQENLSKNKIVYFVCGLIFLIVCARVLLTFPSIPLEKKPELISIIWFLFLIPWILLSVYLFDKYSLQKEFEFQIPVFGKKIPFPGGQFVISVVMLGAVLTFGKIDYDHANNNLRTLEVEAIKNATQQRWDSFDKEQKEMQALLGKRISQNLSIRFKDLGTVAGQSCQVHGFLTISEKEHLDSCDPDNHSYGAADIGNYPTDGKLFRLESNQCKLKDDIDSLLTLISSSAEEQEIEGRFKLLSEMKDEGVYHIAMVVSKPNTFNIANSEKITPLPNTQRMVVALQPVLIPIFTINNKSLEDRTQSIIMESIGHISTLCGLSR